MRSLKCLRVLLAMGCLSLGPNTALASEPQSDSSEKSNVSSAPTQVEPAKKQADDSSAGATENKSVPLTLEALKQSIDRNAAAEGSESKTPRARLSPAQGNPSKQ